MASSDGMRSRPLSPHLLAYRWPITMIMSIMHRLTGAALYFGTALVAWWLVALASGPQAYGTAAAFFGSWFGVFILIGYSWALMHHMLGGVRHLIWDTGAGFSPAERNMLAWGTLVGSLTLTVLIWAGVWALS